MNDEQSPSDGTERDNAQQISEQQPDIVTIQYTVERGTRRRVRFEWRTDGPGWWRIDEEWTGCQWRPVGREVVVDLHLATVSSNDIDKV